MPPTTLTHAILAIKSVCVLAPLLREQRHIPDLVTSQDQLLSAIYEHAAYVAYAGLARQGVPQARLDAVPKHEQFLEAVATHLQAFFKNIKVPTLVHQACGPSRAPSPFLVGAAPATYEVLRAYATATLALLDTAPHPSYMTLSELAPQQEIQAHLETVARSTTWLPWLTVMGLIEPEASTLADMLQAKFGFTVQAPVPDLIGKLLAPTCATGPGRTKVALRKALKTVTVEAAHYQTWVTLDAAQVLAHPAVSGLLLAAPGGLHGVPPLAETLARAFAPQVVNTTPEETAKSAITTLINSLTVREKALTSAQAKQQKEEADSLRLRALAALRALGPLAEVLKQNPDLLALV